MINHIVLLLLLTGLAWSQDCTADDGTPGVELWGECYSIEYTTELDLSYIGVTGEIPPEIGNLINLSSLILKENQLSGEIPPEISYLTNLTQLDLGGNQLSGEIPPEIGSLTNLNILDLAGNQFTGALPAEIGNLANLTELELGGNQLTGSIPPGIGNLSSLTFIHLEYNQFTGEIPYEIGNLTNLDWLNFVHNQLTGEIPSSICNLDMNWSDPNNFNISENQLCPPYPDCIEENVGEQDTTNCSSCEEGEVELWGECYSINIISLNLTNSGLTGEIPPEIGELTNLTSLVLRYNELTGSIPAEIGDLTQLWSLDLRFNNLSGSIPAELWTLTNLEQLRIQKNQFTGSIPPEIGNLTELTHLYLYGNQFSGSIPSEIFDLTNVVKFHLNNNQFTGLIPETICNIHWIFFNSYRFDISGNQLVPPYPDCVVPFVGYQYSEDCESNYLFNGTCTEQSDLDVLQIFIDNSSETINMGMDDNNNGLIEPIELGTQYWQDGRITELNCNYDLSNEFSLSDLGLSGQIPPEIGTLDDLEILWLEDNQLTGPIPSEIGNLEHLKYLILHHNQISGSIPSEIGNLANLEILKLDNNELSGYIPESICELNILFNWGNNLFGENFAVYNNQLCPPYPDCVDAYVGVQDTTGCDQVSVVSGPIPMDHELHDPYPNPFNAVTTIQFSLPQKEIISIRVYDISGRELETIVHDVAMTGKHTFQWDAGDLSSGIYFIRMESRHFVDTKKVSLIK